MDKQLPGVLMSVLVLLGTLTMAEADCSSSCSPTACDCGSLGLTSVPQDLPTTITELDLGHNRITTLSQSDFSRYRSLETVYLDTNHISTINSQALYHLSNLTIFWLFANRVTILRADMFMGLENLWALHLYHNDITDIEAGTFNPTPQLAFLAMNNNRLTRLTSGMFTGLGNLETLYLGNNEINDIQTGTFNPTPQLRELSLYQNKLTTLRSDMFTGLGNLQRLEINSNYIADIQAETFNPTPQLKYLYLSNNNIIMFPFNESSNNQTVSLLNLANNQMTTLPSAAYDTLLPIFNVNIDNNPWQCDCRMVDFRMRMNGSYPFENQITCSQPDSLHGQKLLDINPADLICDVSGAQSVYVGSVFGTLAEAVLVVILLTI